MKHSFAIFCAFREADNRDIDIVPRLDLEYPRAVMTHDNALGTVADHPISKCLEDLIRAVDFPIFDRVNCLGLSEPLSEQLENFRDVGHRLIVKLHNIKDREPELLELFLRFRFTENSDHLLNRMAFGRSFSDVVLAGEDTAFDLRLDQRSLGFVETRQAGTDRRAGIHRNELLPVEKQ